MNELGYRLTQERIRLGLNQTDFSEKAGVSRTSQVNYETDKRTPDANYLMAIASIGVDVLYLLTGQRTPGKLLPKELVAVNSDEAILLDNYRHLSEDSKRNVQAVNSAFAQLARQKKEGRERKSV
jgi:transcriptional regulator with XRE-family HTH domain